MAKRNRATTAAKIEKMIKEGRGQGYGCDYLPWRTIRDVPSQGLSTRVAGWKTGRVHHFLSQGELDYFYVLDWSDVVMDIREQYPLPLEATQEIAERLGIKHPTDPKTKEAFVMTSDFLIDVQVNHRVELKVRALRSANELSSKRKIEKLEIEQTYWKERGVDWGIVTENEIPEALVKNVKWVHSAKDLSNSPAITPKILAQIEPVLFNHVMKPKMPLAHGALEVDAILGLESGSSLWVVRHFIANRVWMVKMNKPIDTGKPMVVIRSKQPVNQVGEHV
ncbi:MAG: Transposon Tn7 transposition protein TnsA [Pelotomaculum sp. PtaB.Bin013]|nr:MAG: Transposon Tn7 transposition protein TnsA [Pelotomaculum sp. PtaB.Bin013]